MKPATALITIHCLEGITFTHLDLKDTSSGRPMTLAYVNGDSNYTFILPYGTRLIVGKDADAQNHAAMVSGLTSACDEQEKKCEHNALLAKEWRERAEYESAVCVEAINLLRCVRPALPEEGELCRTIDTFLYREEGK